MKRLRSQSDQKRRGAALVFTAVTLITLLLCASLAVDVGYICALTTEAQNTADAGALGGAELLQRKDYDNIEHLVYELIGVNQKPQGFLSLDDQIVEIGKWDSRYQKFYPLPPEEWERGAYAVRVRAVRNDAPLFFAAIAGHTETDVWREAVAVGSRPCRGIWGLEGVRVVGNLETDSYDPSSGPYNALNAGSEGDICSGRGVTVNGSAMINGDVMAGFGYPVTVNGNPIITGMTTSSVSGLEIPDLDQYDDLWLLNDNLQMPLTSSGRLAIRLGNSFVVGANDSLAVPPGKYYLSSMSVHSTAKITFTGPTVMYVTGNISAAGAGIINTTQDASNLTIIAHGTSVRLGGAEALYATVIAPNADTRLYGTADAYGALIGRTVELNGDFNFHVDESLSVLDSMKAPPPFLVK